MKVGMTIPTIETKQQFSTAEAACYTGMSEAYYRCGRYSGLTSQPAYYKIGRKIFYLREDLDLWLSQFKVPQQAAA